jgi:hypothetical protein
LLLQERIDEAFTIFKRIKEAELVELGRIQYDYFAAYLDIYFGAPTFSKAREISEKYAGYNVISWRNLF